MAGFPCLTQFDLVFVAPPKPCLSLLAIHLFLLVPTVSLHSLLHGVTYSCHLLVQVGEQLGSFDLKISLQTQF